MTRYKVVRQNRKSAFKYSTHDMLEYMVNLCLFHLASTEWIQLQKYAEVLSEILLLSGSSFLGQHSTIASIRLGGSKK